MTEQDILILIENDKWMMDVLKTARSLGLPDWMIGAGFVRNKVWDYLHGYENAKVPTADIDLIYFDANNVSEESEKEYDALLRQKMKTNWSTKNQARMHVMHGRTEPYKNTEDALSEWIETPTCIAVKLEDDEALTLFAPHGIADLVNLLVKPSPAFVNDPNTFWRRVNGKGWEKKWPKLKICYNHFMEEIEVKFLAVNPAELEQKLRDIGAEKVGDFSYRRRVFDYPDWRLDKQGAWLRLRDEGDRITLSFKQRLGMADEESGENDAGMEETEIVVDDFVKTAQLILKLGFVEKHYAENKRTRWVKDGVEFDIDTYPALEPYLEIEAPTWTKIDEAIAWLGLDPKDKKIFSANQIYALKGINVGDCVRLTFAEGAVKRPGL